MPATSRRHGWQPRPTSSLPQANSHSSYCTYPYPPPRKPDSGVQNDVLNMQSDPLGMQYDALGMQYEGENRSFCTRVQNGNLIRNHMIKNK